MVPRAICLCIVIQIHGQSAFVLHLINLNLETRGLKNNRAAISIGLRQTEKEKEKKKARAQNENHNNRDKRNNCARI